LVLLFWLAPLRYQALLTGWSVATLKGWWYLSDEEVRLDGEKEVMGGDRLEGVPPVV
jgi:hypothetical protein